MRIAAARSRSRSTPAEAPPQSAQADNKKGLLFSDIQLEESKMEEDKESNQVFFKFTLSMAVNYAI